MWWCWWCWWCWFALGGLFSSLINAQSALCLFGEVNDEELNGVYDQQIREYFGSFYGNNSYAFMYCDESCDRDRDIYIRYRTYYYYYYYDLVLIAYYTPLQGYILASSWYDVHPFTIIATCFQDDILDCGVGQWYWGTVQDPEFLITNAQIYNHYCPNEFCISSGQIVLDNTTDITGNYYQLDYRTYYEPTKNLIWTSQYNDLTYWELRHGEQILVSAEPGYTEKPLFATSLIYYSEGYVPIYWYLGQCLPTLVPTPSPTKNPTPIVHCAPAYMFSTGIEGDIQNVTCPFGYTGDKVSAVCTHKGVWKILYNGCKIISFTDDFSYRRTDLWSYRANRYSVDDLWDVQNGYLVLSEPHRVQTLSLIKGPNRIETRVKTGSRNCSGYTMDYVATSYEYLYFGCGSFSITHSDQYDGSNYVPLTEEFLPYNTLWMETYGNFYGEYVGASVEARVDGLVPTHLDFAHSQLLDEGYLQFRVQPSDRRRLQYAHWYMAFDMIRLTTFIDNFAPVYNITWSKWIDGSVSDLYLSFGDDYYKNQTHYLSPLWTAYSNIINYGRVVSESLQARIQNSTILAGSRYFLSMIEFDTDPNSTQSFLESNGSQFQFQAPFTVRGIFLWTNLSANDDQHLNEAIQVKLDSMPNVFGKATLIVECIKTYSDSFNSFDMTLKVTLIDDNSNQYYSSEASLNSCYDESWYYETVIPLQFMITIEKTKMNVTVSNPIVDYGDPEVLCAQLALDIESTPFLHHIDKHWNKLVIEPGSTRGAARLTYIDAFQGMLLLPTLSPTPSPTASPTGTIYCEGDGWSQTVADHIRRKNCPSGYSGSVFGYCNYDTTWTVINSTCAIVAFGDDFDQWHTNLWTIPGATEEDVDMAENNLIVNQQLQLWYNHTYATAIKTIPKITLPMRIMFSVMLSQSQTCQNWYVELVEDTIEGTWLNIQYNCADSTIYVWDDSTSKANPLLERQCLTQNSMIVMTLTLDSTNHLAITTNEACISVDGISTSVTRTSNWIGYVQLGVHNDDTESQSKPIQAVFDYFYYTQFESDFNNVRRDIWESYDKVETNSVQLSGNDILRSKLEWDFYFFTPIQINMKFLNIGNGVGHYIGLSNKTEDDYSSRHSGMIKVEWTTNDQKQVTRKVYTSVGIYPTSCQQLSSSTKTIQVSIVMSDTLLMVTDDVCDTNVYSAHDLTGTIMQLQLGVVKDWSYSASYDTITVYQRSYVDDGSWSLSQTEAPYETTSKKPFFEEIFDNILWIILIAVAAGCICCLLLTTVYCHAFRRHRSEAARQEKKELEADLEREKKEKEAQETNSENPLDHRNLSSVDSEVDEPVVTTKSTSATKLNAVNSNSSNLMLMNTGQGVQLVALSPVNPTQQVTPFAGPAATDDTSGLFMQQPQLILLKQQQASGQKPRPITGQRRQLSDATPEGPSNELPREVEPNETVGRWVSDSDNDEDEKETVRGPPVPPVPASVSTSPRSGRPPPPKYTRSQIRAATDVEGAQLEYLLDEVQERVDINSIVNMAPAGSDGQKRLDINRIKILLGKYRGVSPTAILQTDPAIPHLLNLTTVECKQLLATCPIDIADAIRGKKVRANTDFSGLPSPNQSEPISDTTKVDFLTMFSEKCNIKQVYSKLASDTKNADPVLDKKHARIFISNIRDITFSQVLDTDPGVEMLAGKTITELREMLSSITLEKVRLIDMKSYHILQQRASEVSGESYAE